MSERTWARLRLLGGVLVLALLLVAVGAGPFVEGLRRTSWTAVLVALVVTALTTACCAWRWSLLSTRLGVPIPVDVAYHRYYRSQLLNATLPGGVLGDVHRAVDHGRTTGSAVRGLGSVVWDRAAGQAVQAAMALAALPWLPVGLGLGSSPGSRALWALPAAAVSAAVLLVWLGRRVVLASVLVATGHVAVFVVAARAVGVDLGAAALVALALAVLLASAVPLSLAGWGPREGVAAWLFAQAGLGAATGVSVAVVFGVVSLLATLPGLVTLMGASDREPRRTEVAAHA
ncbi:lysylphosphatidylglycerol synthase domain-containing protein [Nocardioides sp. MH1]|uniref:lysylphosphatidylglycerol synthase domain-containing protein n=1 Tax=Nocardioides sp. MH1 TaxID=3242490 RepID=UPI0035228B27